MSFNDKELQECTVAFLSVGFILGGAAAFMWGLTFMLNNGTPPDNYRKSFDRTLECREKVKTSANIDVICGKTPQWSDFIKGNK
jgi:hypothetical protein